MTKKTFRTSILALISIFFFSACVPVSPGTGDKPDPGTLYTQAAQTVSVQLTLSAGQTAVAQLTQMAAVTPTLQAVPPTNTEPAPTPIPPSATPEPTRTPEPPTPTARPCDWAEFLGDVTVKDGTIFQPGKEFTKVWRLKNIGTCNWTPNYDLVFVSGDLMKGEKVITLDRTVRPSETVDISVDLVSPDEAGDYLGRWQLRNADGKLFGIGNSQNQPFWVSIKVVKPISLVWDMTEDFCLAAWSTGALDGLACPDLSENIGIGFVNRYPFPLLETGRTDNEPALITYPNKGEKGFIQGIFPARRIRNGDHFRAVIGCLEDSFECKVTFQLNYRVDGGRIRNLDSWREKFDKKIQKVDVDLSELAGKDVELILTVLNNGDSNDDWAFWLLPSIWR